MRILVPPSCISPPIPIPMDPNIQRPTREKKIPSSQVQHKNENKPPFTDDVVDESTEVPTSLVGKRISKQFTDGIYVGTIVDTWTDDDNQQQWTVHYDDDDGEDLDVHQVIDAIQLYKLYPQEHRYSGFEGKNSPPTPSAGNATLGGESSPVAKSTGPPTDGIDGLGEILQVSLSQVSIALEEVFN